MTGTDIPILRLRSRKVTHCSGSCARPSDKTYQQSAPQWPSASRNAASKVVVPTASGQFVTQCWASSSSSGSVGCSIAPLRCLAAAAECIVSQEIPGLFIAGGIFHSEVTLSGQNRAKVFFCSFTRGKIIKSKHCAELWQGIVAREEWFKGTSVFCLFVYIEAPVSA